MKRPLPFWLSETVKTFLRYLAVGAAFVPAGFIYSLAVLAQWDRWWIAAICLVLGFATASVVWRKLAGLEGRIVQKEQVTPQGSKLRFVFRDAPWLQMSSSSARGEVTGDTNTHITSLSPIVLPRIDPTLVRPVPS